MNLTIRMGVAVSMVLALSPVTVRAADQYVLVTMNLLVLNGKLMAPGELLTCKGEYKRFDTKKALVESTTPCPIDPSKIVPEGALATHVVYVMDPGRIVGGGAVLPNDLGHAVNSRDLVESLATYNRAIPTRSFRGAGLRVINLRSGRLLSEDEIKTYVKDGNIAVVAPSEYRMAVRKAHAEQISSPP